MTIPSDVFFDIFQNLSRLEIEKCQLISKEWRNFIDFNGKSLPFRFFNRITLNETTGNLTSFQLVSDDIPLKVDISPADKRKIKCLKYCYFESCFIQPVKFSTRQVVRKFVEAAESNILAETLYASGNFWLMLEILKDYLTVTNLALTFYTSLQVQNVFKNPGILDIPIPPIEIRLICDNIPINDSLFRFIRSNEVFGAKRYRIWIQGISPNNLFIEKLFEVYENAEDLENLVGNFKFTPNKERIDEFQLFNQNFKIAIGKRDFDLTKEEGEESYLVKITNSWSALVVFKFAKNNLPTETTFILF